MCCLASNRSVLTVLDSHSIFTCDDETNRTVHKNDITYNDIIQFADGWYSYPDLNTFDSDLLLATLTLRVNILILIYPLSIRIRYFLLQRILNHQKLFLLGMLN